MSHEALSPDQFGFKKVTRDEWTGAQDAADFGASTVSRQGRVNPSKVEVHTGQEKIFPGTVDYYKRTPRRSTDDGPVELIKHQGKIYQGEGHHRMAAARAAGRKSIRVTWHDTGQQ